MTNLQIRLRRLKRQRGVSVKQIALACGVSQQAVHGWLKGVHPKPVHLSRLLSFFDIPAEWLMAVEAGSEREVLIDELRWLVPHLTDDHIKAIVMTARLFAVEKVSS